MDWARAHEYSVKCVKRDPANRFCYLLLTRTNPSQKSLRNAAIIAFVLVTVVSQTG